MDRLKGKVAIVTGAGKKEFVTSAGKKTYVDGTGYATSMLFAKEGAKVLLADISPENANATLAEIEAVGGEGAIFIGDLSTEEACAGMVEAAVEHFGKVNVLFNNVGLGGSGMVTQVEEEKWDRVMDLNLKSMVMACKHAIPRMAEAGGGSIINVSSIDALRAGSSRNLPYAAAKGGMISATKVMAVHHGRDKVRVNCIAPGHLYASFPAPYLSEAERERRRLIGPLGTEGSAWDVAWATVFLASDESKWISGVIIPIDAGLLAATPLAVVHQLDE